MRTHLVPRDKFIAECQARHQTSLLHPEDGSKASGEEYAFNGCESNNTFAECSRLAGDPLKSPVCLLLYTG